MAQYDNINAGAFPQVKESVKIAAGQNLAIGTVLGKKTSSGEYYAVDSSKSDGTQTAVAVLLIDCNATSAAKFAPVAFTGEFNKDLAKFGGTDTLAKHEDALRARSIYFHSVGAVNTGDAV